MGTLKDFKQIFPVQLNLKVTQDGLLFACNEICKRRNEEGSVLNLARLLKL